MDGQDHFIPLYFIAITRPPLPPYFILNFFSHGTERMNVRHRLRLIHSLCHSTCYITQREKGRGIGRARDLLLFFVSFIFPLYITTPHTHTHTNTLKSSTRAAFWTTGWIQMYVISIIIIVVVTVLTISLLSFSPAFSLDLVKSVFVCVLYGQWCSAVKQKGAKYYFERVTVSFGPSLSTACVWLLLLKCWSLLLEQQ